VIDELSKNIMTNSVALIEAMMVYSTIAGNREASCMIAEEHSLVPSC
jgi:hypothetical protein